jgi:surface polysaccharide O-acyltransferase-like enzyme
MTRRYDLDWIRVCAFGVLVMYHVGMYYVTWDWHVKSPFASTTIEPLMVLSSPWRMSLLFLISGTATAFMLKKGAAGFLGPRSLRLLLPLLFGMLVVVPPQSYYEVVEKAGYAGSYGDFYRLYLTANVCRGDECLSTPTWNHLWFVPYLWAYTVALWLLRRFAPVRLQRLAAAVSSWLSGMGLLLWPMVFFAAARLALFGVFGSTHALVDDGYNHIQYFGAFLLGYLIAEAEPVWQRIERLRWPALVLALATWSLLAWYFHRYAGDVATPPDELRQAMRTVWGVNQWSSIVAVLGWARRLRPRGGPTLSYLNDAVFPVYILHQTLIVVLAHHLQPLKLAPLIEGPTLIMLTLALSFAGYEIVRRLRWLRPFFGLRLRPRGSVQPVLQGQADRA